MLSWTFLPPHHPTMKQYCDVSRAPLPPLFIPRPPFLFFLFNSGLFRGFEGAVLRVMVGSGAQLSSYESCKRLVKKYFGFEDGAPLHLASALGAGLVVTTAMNPFDVVSTRLYTQQVGENAHYRTGWRGPLDCISKIAKTEGALGFYKGWSAHYMRLGPHTVFTFMFLEQAKKFATELGY